MAGAMVVAEKPRRAVPLTKWRVSTRVAKPYSDAIRENPPSPMDTAQEDRARRIHLAWQIVDKVESVIVTRSLMKPTWPGD
jgi:hypothetical protein